MSGFAIPDYTPLGMIAWETRGGERPNLAALTRFQTPFEGDTLLFDQATKGLALSSAYDIPVRGDASDGIFGGNSTGESIAEAFGGSGVPDDLTPLERFVQAKGSMLGGLLDLKG